MARYDTEHKAQTRQRIVETAGRRLKRDGIDGSGVAALMTDAGLTNGAFYAHFESKDDLVAHVVADQLATQRAVLAALPEGRAALEQFVREYLSPQHRDDPGTGCPNAALLDEIGRCDDAVRDSYTRGMQSIVDVIATHLSPEDPPPPALPRWDCSRSSSPPCSSPAPSPTLNCPTRYSNPAS